MRVTVITAIHAHGKTAIMRQVARHAFSLRIEGERHTRWGTRREINGDIAYFQMMGRLPHARGGWS